MPRSWWGGVGRERGLLKWTQHNTKTHTVKITPKITCMHTEQVKNLMNES